MKIGINRIILKFLYKLIKKLYLFFYDNKKIKNKNYCYYYNYKIKYNNFYNFIIINFHL